MRPNSDLPSRRVLYTDNDAFVCRWLENLVAAGELPQGDVRQWDIREVQPEDVEGYTQVHWFCGIGGWPLALEMAGWGDEPVWTGSCPCQPFSSAARGRNKDDRDIWPAWRELIAARRPRAVLGEQVPKAWWLDRTADDMEALGYSFGAVSLQAFSVGADHLRARAFFAGHTNSNREPRLPVDAEVAGLPWHDRQPEPVPAEDGLPSDMGAKCAYGNAIVPQVAAEFVAAFMEAR